MEGWKGGPGAWIGALRNQVAGNVVVREQHSGRSYGDAYGEAPGNGPNVVGHKALGEGASLTTPPASG